MAIEWKIEKDGRGQPSDWESTSELDGSLRVRCFASAEGEWYVTVAGERVGKGWGVDLAGARRAALIYARVSLQAAAAEFTALLERVDLAERAGR